MPLPNPCCCCNKVYWSVPGPSVGVFSQVKRRSLTSTTNWLGTDDTYASGALFQRFCFDRYNKVVIVSGSGFDTRDIRASAENHFVSTLFIATAPAIGSPNRVIDAIDCDPTNQRIFYRMLDGAISTTHQLRKVNYNGGGDTLLEQWTLNQASQRSDILYARSLDRVYYVKIVATLGTSYELRRTDSDGSGDTLVKLSTNVISYMAHDIANGFLFWCESNAFTGNCTIKRAGMNGGAELDVYTGSAAVSPFGITIKYSQKLGKLFVIDPGVNSILMMNNDGSGSVSVGTVQGLSGAGFGFPVVTDFALGCGPETVGVNAIL